MPLPDERPRQSVANLIGRFEHQTKRQRASSPTLRSSSVTSHTTGDSSKEEIKEKREWPPRNSTDVFQNTGDAAKAEVREKREWPPRASGVFTPPTADSVQDKPWRVNNSSVETSSSPGSKSSPHRSPLSREPSQSIIFAEETPAQEVLPPAEKPVPIRHSTIDAKSRGTVAAPNGQGVASPKISVAQSTSVTSATKAPPQNAKSPAKTPAKSPPSSYSKSSSLQPVKSEAHDRRTSASATPTASPAPASSRPAARAKTPSASRPKTPGWAKPRTPAIPPSKSPIPSTRSKTPSSAITKSPSTGLYAPTAASLAKARNAQPPLPERKKTISSSVSLDRLSKSTAASLSKMRSPAVVPSPPQRKATRPAKPRASAPARMKPSTSKTAVAGALAVGAGAVATAGVLDTQGTAEVEHHENGHASDGYGHGMLSDSVTYPEIVLSDVEGHDHGEDEVLSADEGGPQHAVEEPEELEGEESVEEQVVDTHSATSEHEEDAPEEPPVHEELAMVSPTEAADPASDLHHADDEEEETSQDESEPVKEPASDIEDIVNLLEISPFPSKTALLDEPVHAEPAEQVEKNFKPESIAVLDQAGEIPDEE